MEFNTKFKGNYTELKIATKFIEYGFFVSFPFGDNAPYDLIVDNGREIFTVQCKTAHIEDGQISIPFERRVGAKRRESESYHNYNVDFICGYFKELDTVYLLSLNEFPNRRSVTLRLTPCLNNNITNCHIHTHYLFDNIIKRFIIK